MRSRSIGRLIFLLAVAIVAGLVAVISFARVANTRPVVALATDVSSGEVIERADLKTVEVRVDAGVNTTSGEVLSQVVGYVAVADFSAGTLVVPEMVTGADPLSGDDALVTVRLDRARYPGGIRAGDLVKVLAGDSSTVLDAKVATMQVDSGVLTANLRVGTDDAIKIAEAMMSNDVALVVVGGDQ